MSLDAPTPSSDEPAAPEHDLLYGIDDKPPLATTFALGFQHYLTMFGSTVAIPLILGPALNITDPVDMARLIGTMFFVSGITTLLQATIGNRALGQKKISQRFNLDHMFQLTVCDVET